jgi:dTDP-4-amino-4,6-dideoxygalactose transaminase
MRIYLSPPDTGADEKEYVLDALESGWVAPLGPHLDGFEKDLAEYSGSGHVVGLSSGTAALHLALILAGVGRDDLVLVSSFTFSASANPVVYQGAIPIFVGSEATTWNMCPDSLEEAIKDCLARGKRPKAIVAVHLYGMPAQIGRIRDIAEEYGIVLIEDAAESLGSTCDLGMTGSVGRYGVFSFNGNKLITSSGGGALLCTSKSCADRARYLSTQARQPAPHYEHTEIGYNYRLSNICAAIGRAQLKSVQTKIERRRENFNYYASELRPLGVQFQEEGAGVYSNRWLSVVLFQEGQGSKHEPARERVRLALLEQAIESRPVWKPMHMQPVFKECRYFGTKFEEVLFELALCLPSGSNLQPAERSEVVSIIKEQLWR